MTSIEKITEVLRSIDTEDLPTLSDLRKAYIGVVFERTTMKTKAARIMGIHRRTLYRPTNRGWVTVNK